MSAVRDLLEREAFADADIVHHGFTSGLRDYELLVAGRDGFPGGDLHRYVFVGCVEAEYRCTLGPAVIARSMDDSDAAPGGFAWVGWAAAWPGLRYDPDGESARGWSERTGRRFHEAVIETNVYRLRLVFADARWEHLPDAAPHGASSIPRPRV